MSYDYRIYVLDIEPLNDTYGDTIPLVSQQSLQDCQDYMDRVGNKYYYVKHEPSGRIEYIHSAALVRGMTSHPNKKFEHPEMVSLVVATDGDDKTYNTKTVVITDGSYDSTNKAVTLKLLNDFNFTLKVTDFSWSYVDAK